MTLGLIIGIALIIFIAIAVNVWAWFTDGALGAMVTFYTLFMIAIYLIASG